MKSLRCMIAVAALAFTMPARQPKAIPKSFSTAYPA